MHPADDHPKAPAAGFSFAEFITDEHPDLPTIPEVLAIADDGVTAMRRAAWMARHDEKARKQYFEEDVARNAMTLRAVPITRSDADTVTELLEKAYADNPELMRTAIGENPDADKAESDDLIGHKTKLRDESGAGDMPRPDGPPPPGTSFARVSVHQVTGIRLPVEQGLHPAQADHTVDLLREFCGARVLSAHGGLMNPEPSSADQN